jgi:hypothetical protein
MSLLAVPVLALAALLGSVMPASAATGPDGFTILYADSGNLVHHCEVIGTDADDDQQAVICVDIDTHVTAEGYQATGEVEGYCQNKNTGVALACQDMTLDGVYANASSGAVDNEYVCNDGGCPAGRVVLPITTFDYSTANCTTSSANDVWDEVLGNTEITTSSGDYLLLLTGPSNDGTSYTSGHFWICA